MLYLAHDFYSNLENAYSSKDTILVNDILNDEIAKIIIFDKEKLIYALSSIKNISEKTSPETVAETIIDEIRKPNQKFIDDLIYIMLNNNKDIKVGNYQSYLGSQDKSKQHKFINDRLNECFRNNNLPLLKQKLKVHKNNLQYFNADQLAPSNPINWKKLGGKLLIWGAVIGVTYYAYNQGLFSKLFKKKAVQQPSTEPVSTDK